MNEKSNLKPNSWTFKLSLLSLSILAQTAPSVSIANTQLAQLFPDQSTSAIELLSTLPNFGVLVLILFAESIAKRFGIKRTILVGLTMYLMGGILPAFIPNYSAFVILRLVMGFGIGLFNPFSVSLMYRFYKDQELTDMLGYQNTSQNLGNAGFGFLLSVLILAGWNVAYMGFAIGLIPLILFGAFVLIPDDQVKVERTHDLHEKARLKDSVNTHIVLLAFLFMAVFAMFLMLTIKMALLGEETGLITPSAASSILALVGLSSMVAAPFFGRLSKVFGNFILPISFTGIALAFFIVSHAQNVAMLTTGVVLAGLFFGWVFPQAFLRVSQVAPKNSGTLTTSVVLMGINFGAAFSAIIINYMAGLFGFTTAAGVLTMCGIGFALLALFEFIYTSLDRRSVS
ncbi:MFS transporter [Streptococcus sp. DD13]|uniref:MFS transporter n=1 Tax=Streptococcus sp. DD13 TaxID=1777881 RepID=UPI00082CF1B4|nr:MFS transporter [Streptococcus sp. DD13]